MKCVVFGGGGFIGSAVVDRLLHDGHALRVFDRPRVARFREFASNESVEWVTGDFLNIQDVSDAMDGMDIVLHLVSSTLPKSSNDDPIYDVQSNIVATTANGRGHGCPQCVQDHLYLIWWHGIRTPDVYSD